ncbi:MAG: hypothetical protein JWQ25_2567 [Daejeonella sp.]|nr:hypothetical protein [Daejeonella sp.]
MFLTVLVIYQLIVLTKISLAAVIKINLRFITKAISFNTPSRQHAFV